jgi:hypothetical protein
MRVSILAVATTLELLLIFVPGAQRWFNDPKAWEFTTQFFFVAILGGAVALVYRHMETLRLEQHQFDQKEQEQRQAQRLSLEEFYRSLVEVHNSCKKVRRTLRAWVVEKDGKLLIETKRFESLMDLIEDVQLRAESSWREVEARPLLFGEHENDLLRHLRTSERYVRELLRQYEDGLATRLNTDGGMLSLSAQIKEFITRRHGSNRNAASSGYFEPADEARRMLMDLIDQNSPLPQASRRSG